MTDDQPFTLDPCYPPSCDSLHYLRHKRMAQFLALRKAQSDVRSLLDDLEYLDSRIEVARKCVQDEMRFDPCSFSDIADCYHS